MAQRFTRVPAPPHLLLVSGQFPLRSSFRASDIANSLESPSVKSRRLPKSELCTVTRAGRSPTAHHLNVTPSQTSSSPEMTFTLEMPVLASGSVSSMVAPCSAGWLSAAKSSEYNPEPQILAALNRLECWQTHARAATNSITYGRAASRLHQGRG